MTDLAKAKKLLRDGKYTCVLCGDEVITSKERGVKPLLELISSKRDCSGFSAADKVIGKAAAFLYVILKIKTVYAEILSIPAKAIFEKYGIAIEYGELTERIVNRSGTGFCPMEQTVYELTDAGEALSAIKNKINELNKGILKA